MKTVLILGMIQGLYDFIGWYFIIGENSLSKYQKLYRLIKEITDFIFTPIISILLFGISPITLIAFYIAKWMHLCDSFYNIYRYIVTNESTFDKGDWRFWTPIGLYRVVYNRVKTGLWFKSIVTVRETWIMFFAGLIISFIIIKIWS